MSGDEEEGSNGDKDDEGPQSSIHIRDSSDSDVGGTSNPQVVVPLRQL